MRGRKNEREGAEEREREREREREGGEKAKAREIIPQLVYIYINFIVRLRKSTHNVSWLSICGSDSKKRLKSESCSSGESVENIQILSIKCLVNCKFSLWYA